MPQGVPWSFETRNPRSMKRDPFEAEFFTGEEENEEIYGRTDALVREAIQNSLDARYNDSIVRVRFSLSTPEQALSPAAAKPYLSGLIEHLSAMGNECVSARQRSQPMHFLVVEDSGTKGLRGDPARTTDPPRQVSDDSESFY